MSVNEVINIQELNKGNNKESKSEEGLKMSVMGRCNEGDGEENG